MSADKFFKRKYQDRILIRTEYQEKLFWKERHKSNMYGHAMARHLPTDCFKMKKEIISWKKFNMLIENVTLKKKLTTSN